MTPAELKSEFEARGITKVKVGGFDIDGVLRGKYIALDKLWSALETGFGFCDVIFGWDVNDVLYDNAKVTGWDTGYPDALAKIDPTTFRVLPWEPGTAAFLCDFYLPDGTPHPACPRNTLRRVLERARKMGFSAMVGAEFEFFMFRETSESMRTKDYRGMTPLSPGMFGYSWLREGQSSELMHAILEDFAAFDVEIEGLHTETGPGVFEVALHVDEALRMADKAALFKTGMKQIASERGLAVTFMAKWNENLPGSSGHLHESLVRGEGDAAENAFYDAAAPNKLSKLAMHYLGGLLMNMPTLTAVVSPTVNSYKRYVPGVWAPLTATWGVENRTCAVRAIPGSANSTRLEFRQPAADMNPYLAIAASVGAGLWGIEHGIEAPAPASGDATGDAKLALPRTLKEATTLFSKCAEARAILGDAFVEHYARTRDWEVRQYERAVTDWELRRYFEII
jgi:glutamine synthetase